MAEKIVSKAEARRLAYQRLHDAHAARFPFPIEGRIPNFKGAETAARLLRSHPLYQAARAIKANPDAPQLPVRAMALQDGKTLYMPTPRLRGAFLRIDPGDVPRGESRRAASLSHCSQYGTAISLTELLSPIDLVVTGSVAVTPLGARAGKGEGYGDLEYAILREIGHPEIPVVTTVHARQILETFQHEPHDLSLDLIVTPEEVIETRTPFPKPTGIDWSRLSSEELERMPVLKELRQLRWEDVTLPDILEHGLGVIFVGLNPGRASAGQGHHFAGSTNHFWKLLHEAGLTPRRFSPSEDGLLPRFGIGITNIIDRATRGEGDLEWDEFIDGGERLRQKIQQYRPKAVVLLGKQVYRAYAGLKRSAPVEWGLQPRMTVPGVHEFLAPNPSSRSTVPYELRLQCFRQVRTFIQKH